MTKAVSFVTLTVMIALKILVGDFVVFIKVLGIYLRKRGLTRWLWFEKRKDVLVGVLVTRRGTYQKPFMHTSFLMLVGASVVGLPIIANSYPSVAADQLDQYTPPSAVLSSLDEQETLTQVSEKPRDKAISHKVEAGETISSIAEKFGVSIDTIKWANPDLKGEKLSIGQELNIPPVTGVIVKVKRGDTIYSLAKYYKTEAQNILNYPFNDFADLDTFALVAGQTLVIPDGVMPESKPVYAPKTIAQVDVVTGTGQFIWPTQGMITQRPVSYHMALDIANSSLPPIHAADAGTVSLVERTKYGYGWYVMVDHANGYQTLYAHMSDIYVSKGQAVSKGSVIGKVGSTGRSSGAHLHFEIRKNGILLNPTQFY